MEHLYRIQVSAASAESEELACVVTAKGDVAKRPAVARYGSLRDPLPPLAIAGPLARHGRRRRD